MIDTPTRTTFAPAPPAARYPPPPAAVDADATKSWTRRMRPILRAHAGIIATGLTCALGMQLLQLAIPRVIGQALDKSLLRSYAQQRARDGARVPSSLLAHAPVPISQFVTILAVLAIARLALGYVYRLNLQKTSMAIEFDLRNTIYEKLTWLPFSYFDKVQSGQLISRANSDIRSVQMYLAFAPILVVNFLGFAAALVFMATISLPLAIVSVITMPLVYFSGKRMRSFMFPASWIVQSRLADVATIVEENVTGTRVVKSFAGEAQQVGELQRAAQRLRWANNVMIDVRARFGPVIQNLPRVGAALVILYGGWLGVHGHITVGDLFTFTSYIALLQAPFMILGFMLMLAQRAEASAGRIFEILDFAPELRERPGAVDLVAPDGNVLFDEVTFAYNADGPNVLDGFRMHLGAGETVALVGRTGCGKSTVARLIPRFYDVAAGAVRIDSHDVRDLTLESLRAAVGLVLDEPFLFSESVAANIAYGRPDASTAEIEAAAKTAGAHEFIVQMVEGYDTVIGERGYTLSGGQRQRIAIARTLLLNPRVLILDDATSSIDVQVELEIHDALRALMHGRTTLIIAHRLSTISLADRVLLMENGRITADGAHNELMRTVPAYAEVLARAEHEPAAAGEPA
ncbi:MAG TPA: ABC transporter ATP-binding protein [Acidimicrobiales bacterium]|nr:ABC transporter ATP-binding protein [Acidimicrobiales bacterium]